MADGFDRARSACEELGASVVELPSPARLEWEYLSLLLLSEVWAYHARFHDRHELYRPALAEFVEVAATFTDAQAYIRAGMGAGSPHRRLGGLVPGARARPGDRADTPDHAARARARL